ALPISRLPRNDWSWAGDLLLDPSIDATGLATFAKEVARTGRPLIWLDAVPFEADRWRRFATAAVDAGLSVNTRESFRVGRIEIDRDWSAYERSWTKNHRRHMRRVERNAESIGGATLVVHRSINPGQVEPLVRRGFEIEMSGWKGRAGSSALSSPAVFELYVEQARLIAAIGQLQITFLVLGDRPIAFEYGWNAKGVYHSFKVGYDESFARLSPGQLLRLQLLRQFFADPAQRAVDFVGPLTDATAKWSTSAYPVGRLLLSGSRLGRLFIRAYRLRRRQSHAVVHNSERTTPGG
ncbi:MAG TPA: GNAT family N-acetyltransferase, partial [Pirellulales bacterium]|nr:GNAT family N-acetyltransferase [Pirellulales bacterium]